MVNLVTDYIFNKTAKTITFTGYNSIVLVRVSIITNLTRNKIIFRNGDLELWGSVEGNILALGYDTSSMEDTDVLKILYDDDTVSESTEGLSTEAKQDSAINVLNEVRDNQAVLYSLIETLNELLARLNVLTGMASHTAVGLRVVGVSMPSTAVTGPITSAQHLANELTKRQAIENLTAIQSNIINITT